MKPNKSFLLSLFSGVLSLILSLSALSVSSFAVTDPEAGSPSSVTDTDSGVVSTDTEAVPTRIQAAYTFDDASALTSDVGGTYPLSTQQFGASLVQSVTGHRNGGMKGYVHLDDALFDTVPQFSMGFWINFTEAEARNKTTLFLVNGTDEESVELKFAVVNDVLTLNLTLHDGYNTSTCTYDMSQVLSDTAKWVHVAYSYKTAGAVSLLTLYVNGKSSTSSLSASYVDLSRMKCETAAFHGITMDDLYFTDYTLDPGKIGSMMNWSAAEFYASELNAQTGDSENTEPDPPVTPVDKYDYTWAAYLFEGTFAAGTDYHSGDIPAVVDNSCVLIDSSKLSEKYGNAMIRRETSVPSAYLTLDSRLFSGHSSFTFSCWVYRNGKNLDNGECLLDLKGNGVIRFAPYATDGDTPAAYVEYTDTRGNTQHQTIKGGNPADPRNQWVHYALTVSESGDLTVYINGVAVETFSSEVNPATLALSECRVVVGASAYDTTRTAIDEVYVTPKALSAAEIRKIHAYGLERYTSEVLPDPGQTSTGDEDSSNPYAPDATDLAQDAYSQTGSIVNGFIGTTFDERGNLGLDWNNGANATVTGGMLTQGVSSYGLSLDGMSFVRYPSGILDNVSSLTLSLSYSWQGPGADNTRSQRLFDFSRKTSSVADPSAYLFLETGNGISGLRFGISDGMTFTYLTCDYSAIDTWTRVTVTVSEGKITLYLNDTVAATGYTDVNLSAICPNFCYLGRSGVKGDPMFTGIIDEVYISSQPLSADQVAPFMQGIAAVVNGEQEAPVDVWGIVLRWGIVAAVALVIVIIVIIVVIITKKEKKSPEDEAPLPVPITGTESAEGTIVGPRVARRSPSPDAAEGGDATVKFRKVGAEPAESSLPDGEMTAQFRKITDVGTDSDGKR